MLTKKEYNEYLRKSFICIRKDDPLESYDFDGLINAYKSFNIKSFYKYSSLESPYTIDNLNKNTFHFSLIQDLNDIFEFSYNVYDVVVKSHNFDFHIVTSSKVFHPFMSKFMCS